MNILVTGGAGFIGSHICDRVVELGHAVTAVDNLVLGSRRNLSQLSENPDFSFVEMDVADEASLNKLFEQCSFECVFHMAANSDIARSHDDPNTDFVNTFRTTYSVLEAMRRNNVRKIVFASTSAIYGEAPGIVREDFGPLFPISHYGAAKLASEAFISSYSENYKIQSWIARFPNVVGDRVTHGAVFDFVRKLQKTSNRLEVLGDGKQIKPYLHVRDLISALLLAMHQMNEGINFFNVGNDSRTAVQRIAEIVVEEFGSDVEIHYTGGDRGWVGDVPSVEYDSKKIHAIGWTPTLDSDSAIRATARWLLGKPQ